MPKLSKILEHSVNVAEILDVKTLEEIGSKVVSDFDKDKKSRKDWEDRSDESMRLALQITKPKNYPWQGAANIKYPLLTTAAMQFAARVDIFTGPDRVRAKVIGWDETGRKTDRAIRIGKHMTWQLTEQMDSWDEDNDILYHALPIVGAMFKKSYFDPIQEHNSSELVWPRDLVFDYWAKNVDKAFRKTHVIYLTPNQIYEKIASGIYLDTDLSKNTSKQINDPLVSDIEGRTSYEDEDAPRTIFEQHSWWDLDGDGYKEPYIFVVDRETEEVLRVVPRFISSSIMYSKNGSKVVRIKPDEYFTQFTFIPNPNGGNLGLGFGHLLGPGNEVVNTLINQLVDSGTLGNLPAGFIGSGIRLRAGEFHITPGEFKRVQSSGEEIARNVFTFPIKEPSNVLFQMLQMMVQAGERIGSVTDAIVGDNPPVNQPATTTLSVIEQGLKVFKRIHMRLWQSFSREFKKLYELNSRYLNPMEEFEVLDLPQSEILKLAPQTQQYMSQRGGMTVTLLDYQDGKTNVVPSADPVVMTDVERKKKIETLLQTMSIFQWNPEVLKKRFVETMEFENPNELLVPPPPAPPSPDMIKAEVEQAKLQLEQTRLQLQGQMDMAKIEMDKTTKNVDAQKTLMEIEKIKMEISLIDAQTRQLIMSSMSDSEDKKHELEVQKVQADYQVKLQQLKLQAEALSIKANSLMNQHEHKKESIDSQMVQAGLIQKQVEMKEANKAATAEAKIAAQIETEKIHQETVVMQHNHEMTIKDMEDKTKTNEE